MQEILAKTTEDFKNEEVINFDKQKDNNFLVLADGVKHISSTTKSDIYEKTDDGKYHFSSIKEVANLKKDDIAVIETSDDFLNFKV